MSIITTGQTSYPIAAGVGRLIDQPAAIQTRAALRSSYGTAQVSRIAVTTATNPFTYVIRGRTPGNDWTYASFTTSATTDTALRNGLVAAWNANAVLRGIALASNAGSGVAIDLTSPVADASGAFEVDVYANSNSALGAPSTVTAASDAAETPFGRYVELTAKNSIGLLSAVAGPTITYTLTWASSDTADATIVALDPFGVGHTFEISSVASGADLPAFLAAVNAALVTALDGTGATVTTDSPDVVVAFPVGWSVLQSSSSATATSDMTNVVAEGDAAPLVGLVYDDRSQSPATIGGTVTGYPANSTASVLVANARVAVDDPGETITYGAPVWIESAAGADLGLPFVDPSPSRFPHPSHVWIELDSVSSLAIIGA